MTKKDEALKAIDAVFADTSLEPSDTRDALEEIQSHIEVLLEVIDEDESCSED